MFPIIQLPSYQARIAGYGPFKYMEAGVGVYMCFCYHQLFNHSDQNKNFSAFQIMYLTDDTSYTSEALQNILGTMTYNSGPTPTCSN